MTKNILIAGVGGQGTLLANRIIGDVLVESGFDVKISEVHGMSQRGGSVTTHVRYGQSVASPIIEKGQADVVLAFEKLEALRYVSYANKNCLFIVNNQEVNPAPVIAGLEAYPQEILAEIISLGLNPVIIDAKAAAIKAGSAKAANVVVIGAFAKHGNLDKQLCINAITKLVPPQHLALNLKAFDLGYNL